MTQPGGQADESQLRAQMRLALRHLSRLIAELTSAADLADRTRDPAFTVLRNSTAIAELIQQLVSLEYASRTKPIQFDRTGVEKERVRAEAPDPPLPPPAASSPGSEATDADNPPVQG